jgi:serine/threonine protein kinase
MFGFAAGTPVAGRYLLVERLSASPGAQIWSAFDDVLGRPVAVKFFPLAVGDQRSLTALRARARATARISHPNVAAVLDVGEAFTMDGAPTPFVVLALIDGELLADRLAEGSLSWDQAAQIGAQIGAALAAAHRRGLTHGEVDPATVMLTQSGAMLLGLVGSAQLSWESPAASEADDLRALGELVDACTDAPPPLAAVCRRAADPQQSAAELAAAFAALVSPHATPVRPRLAGTRRRFGLATMSLMGAVVAAGVGGVTAGALPTLLPTGGDPTQAGRPSGHGSTPASATTTGGTAASPQPVGSPSASTSTTGATGQTKSPAGSPKPHDSQSPDALTTALGQLRDSVTAGKSLGEITSKVASELDAAVADMMIDAGLGRGVKGKLVAFGKRVDLAERTSDITPERAGALHAAIAQVNEISG